MRILYALRKDSLRSDRIFRVKQETSIFSMDYETQISEQAYVPYGWQFEDEDVYIEASN